MIVKRIVLALMIAGSIIILGTVMGAQPDLGSGSKVVYIYLADDITAAEYAELLVDNGIETTLVPLSDVATSALSSFDLILIGYDTGEGEAWGDDAAVAAVQHSLKPVLALGQGGYAFLGQLWLRIGYPNGSLGFSRNIYAVDPWHPIFQRPNPIEMPGDRILELYAEDVPVVGIRLPEEPGDLYPLGYNGAEIQTYPLIQEDARYFFWGFDGGPQTMTTTGRALVGNIADYLIGVRTDVDTLILANGERMMNLGYSAASVANLDKELSLLVKMPPNQSNMTAVIKDLTLDGNPAIKSAYAAWVGNEGKITLTNNLVAAIDSYIESLRKEVYPNLKYIILVGSHEVIPMAARAGSKYWGNEFVWAENVLLQKSGYLYDIYHTKDSVGPAGYYLTDAPYRDLSFVTNNPPPGCPTLSDPVVQPEMAVGRLVETPEQIVGLLNVYMQSHAGVSGSHPTAIGGPDSEGGAKQAAKYMGPSAKTLIKAGFLSNAVLPLLNAHPSVLYFGGHASYNCIVTRKWDQSFWAGPHLTQADITDVITLSDTVIVAPGCHAGLNLGNKLYHAPDGTITYRDFPEEFAAIGVGVFVAHTTHGHGSSIGGLSDQFAVGLIEHLMNDGVGTTAGEAYLAAVVDVVAPPPDPKYPPGGSGYGCSILDMVSTSLTFYGIPNYRWDPLIANPPPKWEYDIGISKFCPGCPETPIHERVILVLDDWVVDEDGVIKVRGADLMAEVDRPIVPIVQTWRVLPSSSRIVDVALDSVASEGFTIEHDIPLGSAFHVNSTMDGLVTYGTSVFDYDGFYPLDPVTPFIVSTPGGEAARLGVTLYPVQYNPATHQTRIWTRLAVTVQYETDANALTFDDDGDGLPDYWEAGYGLDRHNRHEQDGSDGDPDGDGLVNGEEYHLGTDPRNPDSDYDGSSDGEEICQGSDPLNPNEIP